jgi:PilZ domain-containing protein
MGRQHDCHSKFQLEWTQIEILFKGWAMGLINKTVYCEPPPPVNEKRRSPRYPFASSAEAIDLEASTRLFCRLSDIARNGCYIDTISPFAKDAPVFLTVTKGEQSFKTEAKVVYSMVGMGMGLFFTVTEPEQLTVLGTWLDELGGSSPSEQKSTQNFIRPPETAKRSDYELRDTLSELVGLLNVKNILNDSEAMALLRKLSK